MFKRFESINDLMREVRSELLKNDYRFNEIVILEENEGIVNLGDFYQFEGYLGRHGVSIGFAYDSITVKIETEKEGLLVSFYGYSDWTGGNTNFLHCFSPLELSYKR